MAMESLTVANAIIREVESRGFAVSRLTLLLESGRRYRFCAWNDAENPGGVYQRGEQHVAEAPTALEAANALGQMIGLELDE